MGNRLLKYSLLFWVCLMGMGASPLSALVTKTKTFEATYARAGVSTLLIDNQLGDVVIRTHDSPEVRVQVVMKVSKRDGEAAQTTLDKILIEESLGNQFLSLVTEIGGRLNNQPGESVSIDYEVWMPADMNLSVTHKLGKLDVADLWADEVRLVFEHGSLNIGRLTGANTRIEASFVNGGQIDEVKAGGLELNYCKGIFIDRLGVVALEVEGSPITIKYAEEVLLDLEYESILIEELATLRGDLSFGRLEIGKLTQLLELSASHGRLVKIGEISPTSTVLDLNLRYTPSELRFAESASGRVFVKAEQADVDWQGRGFVMQEISNQSQSKQYRGTLGSGGGMSIDIRIKNGTLKLSQQ